MLLKDLFEMPMHTKGEMGDDVSTTTPFFITDERLAERYNMIAEKDSVEVHMNKDLSSAVVGLRTSRHDKKVGIMIYGDIQFKDTIKLGFDIRQHKIDTRRVLQVDLVSVVRENKFVGLGTFLYSSIVQHGYILISDNHQFDGGKELWKKLGRSHLPNEVVYVIDKGHPKLGEDGKPILYDGQNIPDNEIWSADEKHAFVLFAYQRK